MKNEEKFKRFLDEVKSEQVYLRPIKEEEYPRNIFTFEVAIKGDKYLRNEGTYLSFLNLTDLFYIDVENAGDDWMGRLPQWNNTKHIGWFQLPR